MALKRAQWNTLDASQQSLLLRRPAVEDDAAIRAAVLDIVADVKTRGDAAKTETTKRADQKFLQKIFSLIFFSVSIFPPFQFSSFSKC